MKIKSVLQWSIAVSVIAAALGNVLYLTGVWPRTVTSVGSILVIVCWCAVLLYKKTHKDDVVSDTQLDRLRGTLTSVAGVIWLITMGMMTFWRK